jgi:pimeloyl-ACP methyl ester carboxylesterase
VVLESGLGGFSFDWSFVRDDISEHVRVCTYDRAGYGWSDPVDSPQSSAEVAADLNDLLEGAGEPGPYLLVGHSAGGLYVRAFASLFPDEVAGMVLLDSSHENQGLRLTALAPVEEQQLGQFEMCSMFSPFGLMRVLGAHDGSLPGDLPLTDDEVEAWRGHLYGNAFCGVMAREFEALMAETRQTQPPRSMGDTPLVVMTRDIAADEVQEGSGIDAETLEDTGEIALELQRDLARLSTNSTHRIVADSGHYIHWDQPEVVVDAVVETVASIRERTIDSGRIEGEESDV